MPTRVVLRAPDAGDWLVFSEPVEIVSADDPWAVPEVLREIEGRVIRDGLFAAGFIGYEAAPGFDPAFATHNPTQMPPLCFGLFNEPRRLSALTGGQDELAANWRMTIAHRDYLEMIDTIKQQIRYGNTYQINYTVRLGAEGVVDPWSLFLSMATDAPYAAYLDSDDHAILSGSPELFFQKDAGEVTSRPMKGTVRRGVTLAEDVELSRWLLASEKNRAENIMIADMVRNDLGRIATPGSVRVAELCALEKYPTLWQLTSTVKADSDASVAEIIGALFPSASVTGAPKVSSMKIIAGLEDTPREIYTGTIGYLGPDGNAQFNVAIRTAWIDKHTGAAHYGVGGGIVADSEPEQEYRECLTKARIVRSPTWRGEFELLETMLWTPADGFFLLERHLQRMQDSAKYFEFVFDSDEIDEALSRLNRELEGSSRRVRLILSRDGRFRSTQDELPSYGKLSTHRIDLATDPIDADDIFLYHKTTRRQVYEEALRTVPNCDDVLLWNADGYITETSIANVVVKIGGKLVTPSMRSGLLPGTYRQWLLDEGEIEEQDIHVKDLPAVESFTLINSVRGRYPTQFRQASI